MDWTTFSIYISVYTAGGIFVFLTKKNMKAEKNYVCKQINATHMTTTNSSSNCITFSKEKSLRLFGFSKVDVFDLVDVEHCRTDRHQTTRTGTIPITF